MAISKTGMTDMKRSPMKAEGIGLASPTREQYGHGTSVCLDADALKKLGIKDLPEVGDEFHVIAVGKVTSTAKSASETNDSTRVEIQLTHMKLTHEAAEGKKDTPAEEKREVYGLPGGRFK